MRRLYPAGWQRIRCADGVVIYRRLWSTTRPDYRANYEALKRGEEVPGYSWQVIRRLQGLEKALADIRC